MDTPLLPRDETAREIDPDGILDAPDSPVSHTNSQHNASDFANSGSDMSDEEKSDTENDNTPNAATLPPSTGDEDGPGMDTDESGRIHPEDSSVVSGFALNTNSGTGGGSGFVSQLLIQTLSSGAEFRIPQMVPPIGQTTNQSDPQAALAGSVKVTTAAQCASKNFGVSAAQKQKPSVNQDEKAKAGSSSEKSSSGKAKSKKDKIESDQSGSGSAAPIPETDAKPSDVYQSIKAQNKMKRLPIVLDGSGTNPRPVFTECGSFYNAGDNRIVRSVLKEDICSGTVTSLSFSSGTWLCSSCPIRHPILSKSGAGGKGSQGGGGGGGGREGCLCLVRPEFPCLPSSHQR
jgi:hypothetical protein